VAKEILIPNPAVHIDLAYQAAARMKHDVIENNIGYYLLGATSPDIRVIKKVDRSIFHFAPLDFKEIGTGIKGLFNAHPTLQNASDQNPETQAFLAGYLTHLLADETWIVTMFRPFFDNALVFEDRTMGLIMDRAFQLEMDRRCWDDAEHVRTLINTPTDKVTVGFIDNGSLSNWIKWVNQNLDRGFTWDRLNFMARRISRGDEDHPVFQMAEDFVADYEKGLRNMEEKIPVDSLDNYQTQVIDSITTIVEEYLN